MNNLTVGTEFALRWLKHNHPIATSRGRIPIDLVDFCGDIAAAVDAYAERTLAEFEQKLRKVICGTIDDEKAHDSVRISGKDLIESEGMVSLAKRVSGTAFSPPSRFPIDLR